MAFLLAKIRDALRRWLLTPDQQTAVHPNRVLLRDGSTIVATSSLGINLVAQTRDNDDGSGHHRIITVGQAVDPVQFWGVWHRISGQSLSWQSDGTEARPDRL